jgi:LmbE family N-acetylglucosaminyl deacetylase
MKNIVKIGIIVLVILICASFSVQQITATNPGKLKALVVGAHPDDPETGVGGTIIKYTNTGNDVVVLYFTRGEAGIAGVSHAEASAIRTQEAVNACKILKARNIFFGEIDGSTVITQAWYDKMAKLLADEKPDIIFTHWPIDTHRDHRICTNIVFDAWQKFGRKAALYYYEVCTGSQTQNFHPTHHVDITSVVQKKRDASFAHASQKIKDSYPKDHANMDLFRGMENQCQFAEAFVHQDLSPVGRLP